MKRNLIILALALLVVVVMMIMGNVIVIGEKLTRVTGTCYVEYALYGAIIAALTYLLIWPMVRLHLTPEFPVLNIDEKAPINRQDRVKLEKFYKSLMSNCYYLPERYREAHQREMRKKLRLAQGQEGVWIQQLVKEELDERFARIDKKIVEWGKTVFLVTALSQNGRLDAFMVIALNYRMIADIIRASGYRPTKCQLIRQYIRILGTAFFSYLLSEGLSNAKGIEIPLGGTSDMGMDSIGLEDADISSLLTKIKIPGIVTASLVDGLMNTLMTLRVGYVTKAYLKKGAKGIGGRNSKAVRREAMAQSIKTIKPMAAEMFENGVEMTGKKIVKWFKNKL